MHPEPREWDARHLALTKEERSALVARRARALLHMLRGWRRVEDVLMTSIERRRRACMYLIRDAREQMERHGSARFPGHELTYRLIVLLKWSTRQVGADEGRRRLHETQRARILYWLRGSKFGRGLAQWCAHDNDLAAQLGVGRRRLLLVRALAHQVAASR